VKKNAIAGVLSLIHPGLGQIYKRHYKKGFLYILFPFISLILLSVFMILWFIFLLPLLGLLLFVLGFWGYQVIEAVLLPVETGLPKNSRGPLRRWSYIALITIMVVIDVPFYIKIYTNYAKAIF
jgi:hypothetical protein